MFFFVFMLFLIDISRYATSETSEWIFGGIVGLVWTKYIILGGLIHLASLSEDVAEVNKEAHRFKVAVSQLKKDIDEMNEKLKN